MDHGKNAARTRRPAERGATPKRVVKPLMTTRERNGEREDGVRRRIIRAAADIYRECGYERAGMTDIARRVGMTAPALYWYFASKEEILVAFLDHTIADLIQFVRSLVHADEPKQ